MYVYIVIVHFCMMITAMQGIYKFMPLFKYHKLRGKKTLKTVSGSWVAAPWSLDSRRIK